MTASPISVTLAANGRVVIPAPLRAALGLKEGARLVARVVDGAIVIEPIEAAIQRAQSIVARYASDGPGLADDLIADRRAEAARD